MRLKLNFKIPFWRKVRSKVLSYIVDESANNIVDEFGNKIVG